MHWMCRRLNRFTLDVVTKVFVCVYFIGLVLYVFDIYIGHEVTLLSVIIGSKKLEVSPPLFPWRLQYR